jgi:hypothetical protein
MRRQLIKSEFERHSSPLGMAIKQAMIASIHTIERRFDRLPIPMRYRASGAIDTWATARRFLVEATR